MHSDIDTVERVEIIRGLRRGDFDVLVGINLLREGLDIPEVSLVGILDADKEGYLRAERSLIQTIGRAARNLRGKAILYADQVTRSMRAAIDETERRRAKQAAHNAEHGVTPKGVEKAVMDIMEGGYAGAPVPARRYARVAEEVSRYEGMSEEDLERRVRDLERRMYEHAQNLEFEEAARLRDEVKRIQALHMGVAPLGETD
jgi:excinuclease ABC subunit B